MKRWLTAVATVAALLLTGCGGPLDPKTDDPDTLVVHSRFAPGLPGSDAYAKVVEEFEKENPGSHIKNLFNGDDIFNVFETSRLAHKEADVLLINLYDKALAWTDLGATPPVNRYMKEWGLKDRVKPEALKEWTDGKGRLRGFPWLGFTWPVLFNTRLLHKAGVDRVPTTEDELLAAVGKLRAKGIAPMAIGGNDWSGQKLLMQIMQDYMEPAEAKRVFAKGGFCASRQAMKGLTHFTKLRDAGLFIGGAQGFTADQMNSDFFEGRAAMVSAISSTVAAVPDSMTDRMRIGGFPVPADGVYAKPTIYTGTTSTGLWITPNGEKKIGLAEKFVKFMYREDVVQQFIDIAGYVMDFKGQGPSAGRPLVGRSTEVTDGDSVTDVVMPDAYVPAAVSAPLTRATSVAFTRGKSPRTLCDALDVAYRS